MSDTSRRCTAFVATRRIASGELAAVISAVKAASDRGDQALIFDDATARIIDVDFRIEGGISQAGPAEPETPRGPGRPKLGVVAREVTLLPRHWDWLASQPGGASVALRKLVEAARRANAGADRVRQSQEAAYRFMSALAGDMPGFEEATRALFARDGERFDEFISAWPPDVRDHAARLAAPAFE